MTHTFLMDAGRWAVHGTWMERNHDPVAIQGRTLVAWNCDSWFTMATKLLFPDHAAAAHSGPSEIIMQYRGRLGNHDQRYTYVLKHSQLGQVKGEGWIGPQSIVQRFWVLGDRDRRTGFDTIHQTTEDSYHLSSGMMSEHYLLNTMEATLERQSN